MKNEEIKIVAIGDGTVGKTCLTLFYKDKQVPKVYVPTVVDNYSKEVKFNDKTIQLSIWDTAGQEEYERLRGLMYGGTHVFLILYDVTSPNSFGNAITKWFVDIKMYEKKSINIFVGNKIDKRDPTNP